MKGQKQNLGESNQKDREHDRKIEIGKEREIEKEKEREKEQIRMRWNFSPFFNAAIQGGPASGDARYVERRRYYIAARVPTWIACSTYLL